LFKANNRLSELVIFHWRFCKCRRSLWGVTSEA
jgi:hypothetical protein